MKYHDAFLREQQLLQMARDKAYMRGFREGFESGRKSVVCIVPREAVLEAALREIAAFSNMTATEALMSLAPSDIARRALEWKP